MQYLDIKPETIGFDFDGVIADIGQTFLRIACEDYGYCSLCLEDITSFHVESCTTIPETVVRRIFDTILADSLATGLQPLPGALEVLEDLAGRARITIITARALEEPVADWLSHYLSAEACRTIDLIAMSDHDRKVEYIRQRRLLYFVDDRAETCAQVAAAELTPLLYRQPWNTSWRDFITVENWQHLAGHLGTGRQLLLNREENGHAMPPLPPRNRDAPQSDAHRRHSHRNWRENCSD